MIYSTIKNIFRKAIRADEEGRRVHEAVMHLLCSMPGAESLLDIGCAEGIKTIAYA